MYRISEIKLKLNESHDQIPDRIIKKLGKDNIRVANYEIMRESIDARDKKNIKKVYTVDFSLEEGCTIPKNQLKYVEKIEKRPYQIPKLLETGEIPPVVVGFGPGGMFAALVLAEAGLKPVIIERGEPMEDRVKTVERFRKEGILNENSNVQFGEGGAGTFSDGKLTTGIKDFRIRFVLEKLVEFGAPEDILYLSKPHVGTDLLRNVVVNLRERIKTLGGVFRFNTQVYDFEIEKNIQGCEETFQIKELKLINRTEGKEIKEILKCRQVIFATGHSARDVFKKFKEKNLKMQPKPFSMGVRIEHSQDLIDRAQYGDVARSLGIKVAEYKLNHRCKNGRGVYTFCMCPGGEVIIASTETDTVVTNGMSYHNRDSGTANSGLLVDVRVEDFTSDDVLAGVEFQRKYEKMAFKTGGSNYSPPTVTWAEFRENEENPVSQALPDFVSHAIREAMPYLGKKLKGFDSDDALIKGVETRSSSPVRVIRDGEKMTALIKGQREINIAGLYPSGEGAGYAGGIMSSAVDGIKVAEKILKG